MLRAVGINHDSAYALGYRVMAVRLYAVLFGGMMAGLGGIFTEVLKDVTFKRAPFGKREALEMIDRLKGADVLKGARGLQKADVDAVAEAIARLSVFAAKNEAVLDSIDINPLLVLPEGEGAVALDGLIATKD